MALKASKLPLLIAFTLLLLALVGWLESAEAQTQSLTYNLTWTNGAVAADGSNKPDVTIVHQRVREPGSTTFTPWTQIGEVMFPTATFQDKITNDPGARTICYRVAHKNAAGTSAFTPEACTLTPTVLKIPSNANNSQPVIIILGPVTIP